MSRQLFEEARKVLTQEAAVKLDPVGQEDKDVDNDGDADKTDSYLKKRRGAISAAIAKSKNESALSDEDVAKLQAILGEMRKKEEMEDEEDDDEKEMKNEGMQGEKKPTQGPKPGEVPAYMRKDNARQKFPIDLKDLKKEEVEQVDEADELRSRGGIAAVNRMPRAGQTDFRNIAAGNHPESQRKFSDKDRKELPGLLKAKIKSSLGKHTKPNLPEQNMAEEVEQTDEAMSPQAKTTMKHIPNPTAGEMKAAKDIKPGIAGYRDRIDMLKSAEARGGLKKEEVEQIDELSPALLDRAAKKASAIGKKARERGHDEAGDEYMGQAVRLRSGYHAAIERDRKKASLSSMSKAKQRKYAMSQKNGNDYAYEEVEQEDFELIEKLNFEVPENPSYQEYFKAALKMAQVESFSELDEEDQQYIMSEMENAFRQNDTSFILEADMMGDMNDTVQRLRKAGHKVEDMGRDFKGNPYYVYVDKGSMMRRKVIYKGGQKVTQNMGRAQPEKEEDNQ